MTQELPLRLTDLYGRGAWAEFMAVSMLPLVLAASLRLMRCRLSAGPVACLAVGFERGEREGRAARTPSAFYRSGIAAPPQPGHCPRDRHCGRSLRLGAQPFMSWFADPKAI